MYSFNAIERKSLSVHALISFTETKWKNFIRRFKGSCNLNMLAKNEKVRWKRQLVTGSDK